MGAQLHGRRWDFPGQFPYLHLRPVQARDWQLVAGGSARIHIRRARMTETAVLQSLPHASRYSRSEVEGSLANQYAAGSSSLRASLGHLVGTAHCRYPGAYRLRSQPAHRILVQAVVRGRHTRAQQVGQCRLSLSLSSLRVRASDPRLMHGRVPHSSTGLGTCYSHHAD